MEENKNKSWAELEIERAISELSCSSYDEEDVKNDCDYMIQCYKCALKAYETLEKQGHSGMSIVFTQNILNRLISRLPLTDIDDNDDIWVKCRVDEARDGKTIETYQCTRCSSLFKKVKSNGEITYHDNNRYICVNVNNPDCIYSCGLARRVIDEIFPISMPYYPKTNKIKVYCEDFLTDKKNGDFDTVGIFYAIMPDGERVEINRFFKESPNNWEEISLIEYTNRKNMKI